MHQKFDGHCAYCGKLLEYKFLKVAVDFGMATIKPFDGSFYFERIRQSAASKPAKLATDWVKNFMNKELHLH